MSRNMTLRLTATAVLLLAWAAIPALAAEVDEVIYDGAPMAAVSPAAEEGLKVASNTAGLGALPDSVPIAAVSDEDSSGPEKINVVFEKSDEDIMTQQALEKLNVTIESLEFANADLQNVIRIIGERLNINFIFDAGNIDGKVTLRLHNVRLRDALDSILSSRKLSIVADRSGIFRIVPNAQVGVQAVETKTEVIQLNWVSAEDIQKTLQSFISDSIGKIEFNEESNTLIITDVPPQIEIIRELVAQIDKAERQVVIEARLADINLGAVRELGTRWSLTKPNENIEGLLPGEIGGSLAPVQELLEGLQVEAGQGTLALGDKVGIFGNTYDLNAAFTALETRNIVEILANPRVTTLNNVPAKINIVERIPYIQASGMSSSGTSVPTVAFEDAGVDIQVKPIITPNGYVRMEIMLKQMIFRKRVGTSELDPPQIDVRSATTNVIVRDDNTVVLGGLRQQRRLEMENGVPWLYRIPVLGWLFKDKQYDQSKMELVLMMTPKIVEDSVALSDREKFFYDKIDNDWHLPDYYFDDVKSEMDEKETDKQEREEAAAK